MLDEKDVQILSELIKTEMAPVKLQIKKQIVPQLNALSEGQQTILETLAPKNRVEALEDEVSFLKQMLRTLASEVNDLRKAQ
ncbi:MAG: hypothetical protein LKJ86_09650 [Oscillibacter sp.]|jgi:predicted nuclease with TOPRIM domain|nr:hypothetical protein [Oscillibacter sp.]